MILRAAFCFALVCVLMPHEPDLGFGRPHSGISLPASLSAWVPRTPALPGVEPEQLCGAQRAACGTGIAAIDTFRSAALRGLAQVKADIEQDRKMRAGHGGAI